jgi:putative copper export protein
MVFLHLLGAAIWTGGLVFAGVVAASARRTLSEEARTDFFRVLGFGFLVLTGVAAMLLAISGNVLVEDLFGGWDGLGGTEAGSLILWKTAIYGGVLVLAAIHAFVLGPRIRRLRESRVAGNAAGEGALRRAVVLSTAAQVLMLAGTIAILILAADLVT